MGACLTREPRKEQPQESMSRASLKTIFQPEEPEPYVPAVLAKPPQLGEMIEIRTFE